MNDSPSASYETILKFCARTHPQPCYPPDLAKELGAERDRLDEPLNQLRLAGLLELTDWISGKGQGYRLTDEGEATLRSSRLLAKIRSGQLPSVGELPNRSVASLYDGTPLARGDAIRACLSQYVVPRVTRALVALNFLIFAAGIIIVAVQGGAMKSYLVGPPWNAGEGRTTHLLGSLSGDDILNGQWWRLLSCCFVHYGLLHLGMNMYALWVLGKLAEQVWGSWRFAVIYLAAGF
ncbi:MAG TPA: rhomboid family intramembrane serine protease, partial [Gemmataceae bacterium]|nr:rhomboid family intramembrane serine protease [Gemmataceae bacterium]